MRNSFNDYEVSVKALNFSKMMTFSNNTNLNNKEVNSRHGTECKLEFTVKKISL